MDEINETPANPPFDKIETVALHRIAFCVRKHLTTQMLHDVAFDMTKADFAGGMIAAQVRVGLWAQAPQKIKITERPATAWDTIKSKLPARIVAWFFVPVRTVPVWADVEVIYPQLNIAMPHERTTIHVSVLNKGGDSATFRNPYDPN